MTYCSKYILFIKLGRHICTVQYLLEQLNATTEPNLKISSQDICNLPIEPTFVNYLLLSISIVISLHAFIYVGRHMISPYIAMSQLSSTFN